MFQELIQDFKLIPEGHIGSNLVLPPHLIFEGARSSAMEHRQYPG